MDLSGDSPARGSSPRQTWPVAGVPETRFAVVGEDRIAYQLFGHGPPDLLWMASSADCIDVRWEFPPYASFLHRLASFSRVIVFDRRGTGASDPVPLEALPTWEEWADDVTAVLDAVGSERAVILGVVDGGPAALLFVAAHPERSAALILANSFARIAKDIDYPWGADPAALDANVDWTLQKWGTESFSDLQPFYGTPGQDTEYRRWGAKSQRMSCSPREAATYFRYIKGIDARHVLPTIRVPTLVMHPQDSPLVNLSRFLAEHIHDARFVSVEGDSPFFYLNQNLEPNTGVIDEIEKFLTGGALGIGVDRALTALLFTDIVGSTRQAALLGDTRWRELLDTHDAVNRTVIDRHRGRVVKMTGDGVLATFDGPGKALRCAFALRDALAPLGLHIRAGLHAGEVELRGDDIGGIGVHVAARVLEQAEAGEIVTSAAVPLLVAGSGIEFDEKGEHELKGVPGNWKLYSVKD
jgi:class 3 adenylate cyclase/pimeloyl-ACP methyl ester carboxylesterase